MWTRDKSSSEVVHNAWQIEVKGFHSYKLAKKQDATKGEIRRWNKTNFGRIQERIKALENRLAETQNVDPSKENLEMEVALNFKLERWQTRNEIKWNQKSRELWNNIFFNYPPSKEEEEIIFSRPSLKMEYG